MPALDKNSKLELIQRSLGLRHKIKVLEAMKTPENHEDLAAALHSKWELEDELHAIESILATDRALNVRAKAATIQKSGPNAAKASAKKKKS